MKRYNIPSRGIEVVIDSGQSSKQSASQFTYRDTWKGVAVEVAENKRSHANMPTKPNIELILDEVHRGGKSKPAPTAEQAIDNSIITPPSPNRQTAKPLPSQSKPRPVRYMLTRSVALAGALAAVGNIPVHSKVHDLDNSLVLDTQINELLMPATPQETFAGFANDILPSATDGQWKLHRVQRGETLKAILKELKLTTTEEQLLAEKSIAKELGKLKTNSRLLIQTDDQADNKTVKQLLYITKKKEVFIVAQSEDGNSYIGKWDSDALESSTRRESLTLRNPLHYEVSKKDLPMHLAREITKVFAKDVNFRRLSPNDKVTIVFDEFRLHNDVVYTDHIKAAKFEHRKKVIKRVRFTRANGKVGYLRPDSDLELKKVAFDRRPVKRGRLSSGYGFRRHPVFGSRRLHSGADFAAPRGTPIYATGDGKVKFVGRKGGYGKTVMLSHNGGITTLYGHMSGYKKGLRNGKRVNRGDVIGYVGSTGTSTGNHVHYEFKVNGRAKNPMRVSLPSKGILTATEMKNFKQTAKRMESELKKASETANIDRNVRTEFGG